MPAFTSHDRVAIRGAPVIRLLGWWICSIALIGLGVVTVESGAIAFVLVGLIWTTPAFWWGWRISHIGVFAESAVLVICNPLRTHRIRYDDITDVRTGSRFGDDRARPRVLELFNRRVGTVVVRGVEKPIEMRATEWLWSSAVLGHSRTRSDDDVSTVRSAWLERRSAPL